MPTWTSDWTEWMQPADVPLSLGVSYPGVGTAAFTATAAGTNASAAGFSGQDVVDAIVDLVRAGTNEHYDKTGTALGPGDLVATGSEVWTDDGQTPAPAPIGLDAQYHAATFFVAAGLDITGGAGYVELTSLEQIYRTLLSSSPHDLRADPVFDLPPTAVGIDEVQWEVPYSEDHQGAFRGASSRVLSLAVNADLDVVGATYPWVLEAWLSQPYEGSGGIAEVGPAYAGHSAFWHRHGTQVLEQAITAGGTSSLTLPMSSLPDFPSGATDADTFDVIAGAWARWNLVHRGLADGGLDTALTTGGVDDANVQAASMTVTGVDVVLRPSRVRVKYAYAETPNLTGEVGALRTRWDRSAR